MILNKLISVMFLLLLFCTVVFSQNIELKNFNIDADAYFSQIISDLKIPGFAISVVKGEKTLLSKGYGIADEEKKLKSTSSTNYYIASTTKAFTGLLACLLDEKKIIKLDDNLDKYFPDLKLDSGIFFNKITIRDLLTHTSGLENQPIAWRVAYSGEYQQNLLQQLMKYTKSNEKGFGKYEYTNIGYNIYALILEKETGKSWQYWMEELIFKKAGMNHTSTFISSAKNRNWVLAKPYLLIDSLKKIQLEKKDSTMHSAGGVISTADDMAIWLKLQVNHGQLDGKQIFPEKIMILAQTKLSDMPESKRIYNPTKYGFGWMFGNFANKEIIHHFGSFAGYSSHISYIPDLNIGVSVMINEALVGDKLMNIIANFSYDYLIYGRDSTVSYINKLKEFSTSILKLKESIVKNNLKNKDRKWLLSKDFKEYCGKYFSEEYGTMIITKNITNLSISLGNMCSESTPFTNQESIRVELIPNKGQVIEFITNDLNVIGLKYDGINFQKIDN